MRVIRKGFISAVFDNIPLTKLCLEQGGYDWGMPAFTVGFDGSAKGGTACSSRHYRVIELKMIS